MTTCKAPGSDCTQPAVDAVSIVSPVPMQIHGPFAACAFHLEVYRSMTWRVEIVEGPTRARLLKELRPMVVGGVPLEDWAPGEVVEAFGR